MANNISTKAKCVRCGCLSSTKEFIYNIIFSVKVKIHLTVHSFQKVINTLPFEYARNKVLIVFPRKRKFVQVET